METLVKNKHSFVVGNHTVDIETGVIARQAAASVRLQIGETVILATVTHAKSAEPRDFFPLAVHYLEAFYSVGRMPGGFIKRETKPSEREVLVSRLIDRAIRPLFPKGYTDEVNVVIKTLSSDPMIEPDIPAMIAASAALSISPLPFECPIAATRVGLIDDQFVLNPSPEDNQKSTLDLVIAGSDSAILMVEAGADGITEDRMLDAIDFAHTNIKNVCQEIHAFQTQFGAEKIVPQIDDHSALAQQIEASYKDAILTAFQTKEKLSRKEALAQVRAQIAEEHLTEDFNKTVFNDIISSVEKKLVRNFYIDTNKRIDGRNMNEVRPISVSTNTLPRAHGDCLFTRGETQALVITTLGGERDAQMIDNISTEDKQTFMLHYNFPPYCVGEVGMLGAPKRREIGHGRLAKRALEPVIPAMDDFSYVIRLVSEITESNGSSSMASVCGGSLALMAAGVPIKNAVAGIAMGLIKLDDKYVVLSDISGDEDHFGHMDFKVAGTDSHITALQMDIKVNGLDRQILKNALEQAKEGRNHILSVMNQHMDAPKSDLSRYAPRMSAFKIKTDKIRDVIGKGGATIREITEKFDVTIDITDDGLVKINAVDGDKAQAAQEYIERLTKEIAVGEEYDAKIIRLMDFGAIVSLLPGQDGFLHISQISHERIENINSVLSEGQVVHVKVVEVDRQNRIKVSMKDLAQAN